MRCKRKYKREENPIHLLMTVSMMVKRLSFKIMSGPDESLTPEQWILLKIISEYDGLLIGEIAELTMKDVPNVIRMVSKLEKMGFVEKRKGKLDQRKSYVYIQEAGEKARKEKEPLFCSVEDLSLAPLNKTEQQQLYTLLEKIKGGIMTEICK